MNDKTTDEEWRAVVDYEGLYEVSNLGRVRRLDRVYVNPQGTAVPRPARFVSVCRASRGYRGVSLRKDGIQHYRPLHRLIAQAFIPNPDNKPFVNHLDSNPANNSITNLEWVTAKENTHHCIKAGRMRQARGEDYKNRTKLSAAKIHEMDRMKREGAGTSQIARAMGVALTTAHDALYRNTWKHIPPITLPKGEE